MMMLTHTHTRHAIFGFEVTFLFIYALCKAIHEWNASSSANCLAKPVSAHTVARPFRLAYPAPLEAASSSRTNHVHAAAGSFCWRSTLWTRLRDDFDGDF